MPPPAPATTQGKATARANATVNGARAERTAPIPRATPDAAAFAHDLQSAPGTHDPRVTQHTSAPSPDTTPVQADLGALVDRLIAARQASHASSVVAHVAHADFGRIDLRFATDATGLTVDMRSHDPDFAPSAQAAANVAPPQSSSDSRSARDSPQQQSAAAHNGPASQSFARDQGRAAAGQTARESGHSGGSGGSASRAKTSDQPKDPRGIYA